MLKLIYKSMNIKLITNELKLRFNIKDIRSQETYLKDNSDNLDN
jgi:hypothetical protein